MNHYVEPISTNGTARTIRDALSPTAHAAHLRNRVELSALQLRSLRCNTNSDLRLDEFFSGVSEPIVRLEWVLMRVDLLMVHRAVEHFLSDWHETEPVTTTRGMFNSLRQIAVEVARDKWDAAACDCLRFWERSVGEKIVLEIYEDPSLNLLLYFLVPRSLASFVYELQPRMEEWIAQNHFLRGQKFSGDHRFLRHMHDSAWDNIILPPHIRQTLEANSLGLLEQRDIYRRVGIPLKRGILLHGPPGTGKTMIGRALAQSCPCTFILLTTSMLDDGGHIRHFFRLAERLAPTILFFEDIDLVGADRRMTSSREVLGELLSGLDGLDSSEGVITIATTNNLTAIEPALKDRPNRFDVVLEVPAMDDERRRMFVERWLAARDVEAVMCDTVIEATTGFTGAQMQEVCRAGVMSAIERLNGGAWTGRLTVTEDDFMTGIRRLQTRTRREAGFGRSG